ncbi:MAG: diguanylate cyclase [Oscillospiraceae bacterium]
MKKILFLLALLLLYMISEQKDRRRLVKSRQGYQQAMRRLLLQTARARILEETSDDQIFQYFPISDILYCSYFDADGSLHEELLSHYMEDERYCEELHPDFKQLYRCMLQSALQKSIRTSLEYLTRSGLGGDYEWRRITLRSIANRQGQITHVLGRVENIHALARQRDLAFEKASRDSLTGILNKTALYEQVSQMLQSDIGVGYALLMIDLDNFKCINDTCGHPAGDKMLVLIAHLLQRVFSADDVIGRFGGDEFMVFMRDVTEQNVQNQINIFLHLLEKRRLKLPINLTCSVGYYYGKTLAFSLDVFLTRADQAMYLAKQDGKNGYRSWEEYNANHP